MVFMVIFKCKFVYEDVEAAMDFLENIKSIPIVSIAEQMGFCAVRKGRYYSLKEHDSVIIDADKNCFWRNSKFSKGVKGGAGSTIDFVMEFGGESDHKKAMRKLAVMYGIGNGEGGKCRKPAGHFSAGDRSASDAAKKIRNAKLALPKEGAGNEDAFRYLLSRGISRDVIRYFIDRKMLYQDAKKNCVFVSPSHDCACIRGTGGRRFVRDCEGSNYDECFYFKGNSRADKLVVAESVIDIMSIMTYLQICGMDYQKYAYLSTLGTNKIHSLRLHLLKERELQSPIRRVYLCNDNDEAGCRADRNAIGQMESIGYKEGEWRIEKSPAGKDWNDYIEGRMGGHEYN